MTMTTTIWDMVGRPRRRALRTRNRDMMRIRVRILAAAAAAAVLMPGPAAAQQVQRIAAIVNDDIISIYDLQSRIGMVIISSRLSDSAEIRRRLAPRVLRSLVDERLQLHEAKRRNVSVGKRDMKRAMATVERRNKVAEGELETHLRRNGIEPQTVLDQLRANIAWSKLVRRRLRPRVTIGDEEIDAVLERLRSGRGQTEYRLAEIFLAVDRPNDEAEVGRVIRKLVEQVRGGARFDALARQFSDSATAAVGGDMGWVREAELGPALRRVVDTLAVGQIGEPLRTLSGQRVVMLRDRRRIAGASAREIKLALKQIFLPLPATAPAAAVASQMSLARILAETVTGCQDMARAAREAGSPRPSDLGKFALSDLSPALRTAVDKLEVGKASRPIRMADGVLVAMVCARNQPKIQPPDREQIADRLRRQRLDLMARRYLRDIRRAAVVDIRL